MIRSRPRRRCAGILVAVVFAACHGSPSGSGAAANLAGAHIPATITVSSLAFTAGGPMPRRSTCDGGDVSPPLQWSGVPSGAGALAIVVDDPDAQGTYVHWVLFGLQPSLRALREGVTPAGASQAKNSAGDARYKGPCPPKGDGPHHYRFTVYALRSTLPLQNGAGSAAALRALRAGAIAKGTVVGTFDR